MATNIVGVTMPQPTSDPNIQTGGNFTMGGQISVAGGGSWAESGDMYFEWDQGTSTWTTIGTSGGLYHSATNPLLGLQTAVEQTITIYSDTAGSYQVRVKLIEDDLTEYTTTAQTVTVNAPSNAEASAESCDHLHDGESPVLTQVHNLAVAEAYHDTDDNGGNPIAVTQLFTLTLGADPYHLLDDNDGDPIAITESIAPVDLVVAEANHLHDGEPAPLTQDHGLVVQELDHLHDGAPAPITQDHYLTLGVDPYHDLIDDGPLTLSAATTLTVAAAAHLHAGEAVLLTQDHALSAAESTHLHAGEPVSLTQDHALAVAAGDHLHFADNINISGATALENLDADHLHLADTAPLSQVHALVIDAGDHLQVADTINLGGAVTLENLDADHLQVAEAPVIGQNYNLSAAEAAHILTDQGPLSLSAAFLLTMAGAVHLQLADAPVLTGGHYLAPDKGYLQSVGDSLVLQQLAAEAMVVSMTEYRSLSTRYSFESLSQERIILTA
jgi:hypothetical protein